MRSRARSSTSSLRVARRLTSLAVVALSCSCGTLVQVVDKDGAPVSGARVAPEWTFYGDWSTTDDDGYARIDDGWVGLAWPLQPTALVVRTAKDEFHVAYPLPSPVRLPVAIARAEPRANG